MEVEAESHVAPRPGLVLAILALGVCAFTMLQSLVVPALPVLQHELHTTPTGVTWIFTTYLLAASVATPIAGRFGDMFGKKRALLVVLTGLAAGSLLAALATSLPLLIVARTIQGVGGAVFPLAIGIIRDEFPRERVQGGIGLISGLLGIGGGLGIVLAGPILTHLGYHWLFWIPLVVVVVTMVATWIAIPESPVRAPGRIDWPGAGLLSVWLVCLLLGISEAPNWGWTLLARSGSSRSRFWVAITWVAVERRSPSPLVDIEMMRLKPSGRRISSVFSSAGGCSEPSSSSRSSCRRRRRADTASARL